MKRQRPKDTRNTKKSPVKNRRAKPEQQETGAPPADFLLALKINGLLEYNLEQSQESRQKLAVESTREITKRIWLDLLELANRVLCPRVNSTAEGLENAADNLAAMAGAATTLLNELAAMNGREAKDLITAAAMRRNRWPVNLQIGTRRKNGKLDKTLVGAERAKQLLVDIGLGTDPTSPVKSLRDPQATVFAKAAEMLLYELYRWREQGAWRNITVWSEDLMNLESPMTTKNVEDWWSVAKRWMDEQWETNRDQFQVLARHLNLDNKNYKPSLVKTRVIDDSMKKAFKALANSPEQ